MKGIEIQSSPLLRVLAVYIYRTEVRATFSPRKLLALFYIRLRIHVVIIFTISFWEIDSSCQSIRKFNTFCRKQKKPIEMVYRLLPNLFAVNTFRVCVFSNYFHNHLSFWSSTRIIEFSCSRVYNHSPPVGIILCRRFSF